MPCLSSAVRSFVLCGPLSCAVLCPVRSFVPCGPSSRAVLLVRSHSIGFQWKRRVSHKGFVSVKRVCFNQGFILIKSSLFRSKGEILGRDVGYVIKLHSSHNQLDRQRWNIFKPLRYNLWQGLVTHNGTYEYSLDCPHLHF